MCLTSTFDGIEWGDMSKFIDQIYLQADQYKDEVNLEVRSQFLEKYSTNTYSWHQWVFDHLTPSPQSNIVDVGCGSGHLWVRNAARIPSGWNITLVDLSSGMLYDARNRLSGGPHALKLCVADAQYLPFPSETFDATIANHVLYHVPNIEKAFSEVHRVLRIGGHFYATTLGRTHLQEVYELVSRFEPDARSLIRPPLDSFRLENGLAQISEWFSDVSLYRYEDKLVLSEAEPLVDYVLSTPVKGLLGGYRLEEFRDFVRQHLAAQDIITITKDLGLFKATKDKPC